MSAETASAWPGTVKAARAALGSSGGNGCDRAHALGHGLGDLLGCAATPRCPSS